MTTHDHSIFPKGAKLENGYFTGDVYLTMLLAKDRNNEFAIGNVTFEAGARTNWHTHPRGQVLLILSGKGYYQEKGHAARAIQQGDVVNIPEDVEHWHGASSGEGMTHLAITNYLREENVVWLKPVSNDEYIAVQQ